MANFQHNIFVTNSVVAAANEYEKAIAGIAEACQPPKKKVYNNMTKMLEESYFVGSLKYGNNFIA